MPPSAASVAEAAAAVAVKPTVENHRRDLTVSGLVHGMFNDPENLSMFDNHCRFIQGSVSPLSLPLL